MLRRRLLSIPLFVGLTALLTALSPLLLVLASLVSLVPATRGALPTLGFVLGYLWCETIGIVSAFVIWINNRTDHTQFLNANYRLQCWWSNALKIIAEKLFRLRFEVADDGALNGPPGILLPRHASIADTIIPMVYYAIPHSIRLRYVLKQELLIDPCLDIVGHRLPNFFVDRGGQDSERARQGVVQLLENMGPNEGLLLYPEGTRYSEGKRRSLQRLYADSPEMQEQLSRWRLLLPPRLGGIMALLKANPGRDLIFCAHSGFEGSSHFRNLINGSWMGAHIRICFWRVPFENIPTDAEGQRALLFEQWDRMHGEVERLAAGTGA